MDLGEGTVGEKSVQLIAIHSLCVLTLYCSPVNARAFNENINHLMHTTGVNIR